MKRDPGVDKWLAVTKRHLLKIVCLNSTLDGESLVFTVRKPFDLLANGTILKNGRGAGIRTADAPLHNVSATETDSPQVRALRELEGNSFDVLHTSSMQNLDTFSRSECAISVHRLLQDVPQNVYEALIRWRELPQYVREAISALCNCRDNQI